MKRLYLIKLAVFLLLMVTLSGCLLVPVGVGHSSGGGNGNGHYKGHHGHDGHDRD